MPLSRPSAESRGLTGPLAAVVALTRHHGADSFDFATSGFENAEFQRALLQRASELSVSGLILVELERGGRLAELKSVSGFDGASELRLLRRQAAMWDLERDFILRRLAMAGIPAVLLKGAALRFAAYRDSAERGFGDIDVLVPKDVLDSALTALMEAGYEPESKERQQLYLEHHHHLILKKPRGFVVEVHWALAAEDSPFALDPAAFLRDARTVTAPGGATVPVPSPEHMALHLAQQNLEDGFSLLRRLVDVDRLVTSTAELDWPRLASESKRMRVQGIVALALRLAEILLDTPVPPGFIRGLGLSTAARAHLDLLDPVRLVMEQRGRRRAVRDLLLIWCLPDLASRIMMLRKIGTADREQVWTIGRSGPWTRFASLVKLIAYQIVLYPSGLLDIGAGTRRRGGFWGKDPSRG